MYSRLALEIVSQGRKPIVMRGEAKFSKSVNRFYIKWCQFFKMDDTKNCKKNSRSILFILFSWHCPNKWKVVARVSSEQNKNTYSCQIYTYIYIYFFFFLFFFQHWVYFHLCIPDPGLFILCNLIEFYCFTHIFHKVVQPWQLNVLIVFM